jgi:small-conductance mechanosensitive channel
MAAFFSPRSMSKKLYVLLLPLMAVLAISVMATASAAPVINTLDVSPTTATIKAGASDSFTWVVYNNGTTNCLVLVNYSASVRDQVDVAVPADYTALEPGQDREITVTVTPHHNAPTQDVNMTIYITVTEMSDPSQAVTIEKPVSFHIDSIFGSSGQNKIMGLWANTLPSPLDSNWAAFGLSILGWLLVSLSLIYVVEPIIHQLTKKTETELDDLLLEAVRMPVFITVLLFGVVTSLQVLYIPTDLMITIQQTYQLGFILLMTWLAYRVFNDVVVYLLGKLSSRTDTELDDVLVPLLQKIGMILIPLVALLVIFQGIFNVDITLLVASMGVIGIVIGYAAQQSLGNFFAGIQILLDRPFKIGDLVELDSGETCEIKKIGLRATTMLNTSDNEMIILPNNDVANKKVVNISAMNGIRTLTIEVGVAYGTDVEKVKRVLLGIANAHPDIIKEGPDKPYTRLAKFNDSSIDFKLCPTVDDARKQWRVGSELREAIDKRFKEEGIEIPFPQSVVSFKSNPETITVPVQQQK